MVDVSVIIASKNEQNYIANTLSHLQASMQEANKRGINSELIVVDSSDDNTAEISQRFTENVHKVPADGVSRARNVGAAKSKGRILAFMDADTIVQNATITDVFEKFQDKTCVSTISLVAPTWHSKLSFSGKAFYALDWAFIKACGVVPFLIWFYNRGDIIAIRQDAFKKIGGFDESLYMMEITDLLGRASKLGKTRVLSAPVFESSRRLKHWGVWKSYQVWWRNYFSFYMFKRLHEPNYEVVR
jgi:glycosyltransferase involved in cell wall biosynthesis